MTTPWTPQREWDGLTVAIFGGGPSMNAERAEAVLADKKIAVNHALSLVPDADMLVALDADWPLEFLAFEGIRVTGGAWDLDALNIGHRYDRIELAHGYVVELRNSGLAAFRVAREMGAAKIILLGFDPELKDEHFDDYPSPAMQDDGAAARYYDAMRIGLLNLIEQARAAGIAVEHLK